MPLLVSALLLGLPRAVAAVDRLRPEGAEGSLAVPDGAASAELVPRAVLPLTSPPSPMVRIPEGEILMGSEESEVLEALADCTREPYGHRCTPTLFANELPRQIKKSNPTSSNEKMMIGGRNADSINHPIAARMKMYSNFFRAD